jgi:ribosomal protein S18 acetylase RimI-like enzyme
MSESEVAAYIDAIAPPYAAASGAADPVSLAAAERYAGEAHARLLPQGGRTPGHHFRRIVAADGATVGHLWLHADGANAFLYDITIEPEQRRRGFAIAALRRVEELARASGCVSLGLRVLTANAAAVALYAKAGFVEASRHLSKPL